MISDKNFVDAAEGKTYFILNYGCQMNESDAEHYAGQLEEMGYAKADDFHNADIIVVNTCCVRESAEKRILGKIGELKRVKENHPGQVICVAGCMAQKDGEKLIKKHPQIDLLIGTAHVNSFKEILTDFLADKGGRIYDDMIIADSEFEGNRVRQSGFSAWIPIMYGCNNFCTYCIVPYVRGRERSRPAKDIISEVNALLDEGYKEITLLGQNVDSYGNDLKDGSNFASLLGELGKIGGKHRIRFMTSHPKDFNQSVAEVIEKYPSLCHNIHLPVQSGNNSVLKRMNRRYTREQYLELVRTIRTHLPDVGLTTDVMVGFAGETEEDFNDTLSLMEEVRFSSAFCFVYSRRKGTPGYSMENQVSREVKTERIKKLIALQNRITKEISKEHEGKVFEILVEDKNEKFENTYCGRTDGGRLVNFKSPTDIVGQFVDVKIKTSRSATLWGDLITEEK